MPHNLPLHPYRRDPANPRSWQGIRPADAALLQLHLPRLPREPWAIYTGVPVGPVPDIPPDLQAAIGQQPCAETYCLKADLVLRWPRGWEVVELKPAAGYVALGQALLYAAAFAEDHLSGVLPLSGVWTDQPHPTLPLIAQRLRIDLRALPGNRYVPLGRPT